MHLRLAYKNVKRNRSTYLVYFMTLTIIYGLIYSFTGVLKHPMFNELSGAQDLINRILNQYMPLASAFVLILLALLVLYVSDFVMRRRQRELGLYSSLGMRNSKIGAILSYETGLVNCLALISGLLLGQVFSAGLTLLAKKLFSIEYDKTLFYFSGETVLQVFWVFVGVVLVSAFLTWRKLRKIRIISFLSDRDEESVIIANSGRLDGILFTVSIVLLLLVLFFVRSDNLKVIIKDHGTKVLFALIVAVLLFYYSLSHALINLSKKNKKFYYKGYNTLTLRQVSRNLGKNIQAMALLSLSLGVSIILALASESSLKATNKAIDGAGPYDFMVIQNLVDDLGQRYESADIKQVLIEEGLTAEELGNGEQLTAYEADIVYEDIIDCSDLIRADEGLGQKPVEVIKVSDYNKAMRLQGSEEVHLGSNEFMINCNHEGTEKQAKDFLKNKGELTLAGVKLTASENAYRDSTFTIIPPGGNDRGTLIVNDEICEMLPSTSNIYITKFTGDVDVTALSEKLNDLEEEHAAHLGETGLWWEYMSYSKKELSDVTYGFNGVIVFIMLYLDIVIIIISLSILSIQSTSEITEQADDFSVLKSLGTTPKQAGKLVSRQILMYFIAPMILAIPFAYVGTNLVIRLLEEQMKLIIPIKWTALSLVILLLIVYIVITNSLAKRTLKSEMSKRI
ncbi:hypothetical protein CL176_00430 [Suicoccus acidiformans]|uniref:ABC3 transporter permease C-terminal domain-containing protein n=1 Tax=Suicoccus acidiformans TaxID=2036206 RepID=A0A347WHQ9_9LACT|nr:ABC transporter permease [Suicoccus acidiformans]AXY24616.1 hypothetical protein CL176_00430 [Suicoccus acidiformans]